MPAGVGERDATVHDRDAGGARAVAQDDQAGVQRLAVMGAQRGRDDGVPADLLGDAIRPARAARA